MTDIPTSTDPSLKEEPVPRRFFQRPLVMIWCAALAAAVTFATFAEPYAPWAFKYPRAWRLELYFDGKFIELKNWISKVVDWLISDASFGLFTFTELTRGVSWIMERPYILAKSLLSTGFLEGQGSAAIQILPPLSWIAVIVIIVAMARFARDRKLAALVGACFLYLALFNQWSSAMVTLSSIVIAVPFGVAGGLLIGIAAHRSRIVKMIVSPVLDLMQTVPVFAYLVPILVLFGFGPVSAIIATIIYAMPPMVRITMLALKQVPGEIIDLGNMVGCTRRQMTWRVMVPSAMSSLMIGVNQVIMLSLNMVIIASMIGAGGLGYDVLASLRRLDIGAGIEAGVGIVVLAIALDRLSQAFASREPSEHREERPSALWRRFPYTAVCLAVVLATGILGLFWGWAQAWPAAWSITTGDFWSELVKYININFFDELETFKNALLLNVLIPFKRFLIAIPWPVAMALLGLAGYSLGGWRLGVLCALLCLFVASVGLWSKAMVTVYLCGISVMFACLIGIPVGIAAAERERVWRVVRVVIDTLQTLPSFVYLMPVVMLFRVGDFTAMIAVVAYALAPAVRYTAHGIRQVDPQLLEAGVVSGCTPGQLLRKIKLKLALPEIMLGINQTIMLALSMLVITALVGTRELGQEVYIALTKADIGRGLVAGFCVAFIAIIADRLITAGAQRARARLGLQ